MDQKIWGPGLWLFLHTMTFNYPVNPTKIDKQKMRNFLLSLGDILPCKYCRDNFRKHLNNNPIKLDSKRDLVRWMICIHNEVNEQEGKQNVKELDVIQAYEKIYSKKLDLDENTRGTNGSNVLKELFIFLENNNKNLFIIILIILLLKNFLQK